ncbi:MAG: GNAT family N-acetyltransferase [Bacteroidota bacterium]
MITVVETRDYKLIAALNEEVQNLHASLHPEMFKPFVKSDMEKALENYLNEPNAYGYLVQKDGIAIGCAVFFIREAKENAFHYTIKTLYVDQISVLTKHQRTGAGKMLMDQAEKLAKEKSIQKIELDHWSANVVAASYFRKSGYKLYRERLFKVII